MDPIKQVEERIIILWQLCPTEKRFLFLEGGEEGAILIFAIELKLTGLR